MGSRALWDCGDNSGYNFRVTSSGSVQVENHSNSNEPDQEADVFINGSKVINDADVPAMKAGTGWTSFESINPPPGSWEWRVVGESDCGDDGEHSSPTSTPPPPTKTPEPTATPEPTFTDVPTETLTPEPTDVPPTQTAKPTDTSEPKPSDTPKPDPTDTPKPQPRPTNTPKPAPTSTHQSATSTPPVLTLTATPVLATPTTEAPPASYTPMHVCVTCGCPCESQTPIVVEVITEASDLSPVAEELKPIFYVMVGIFAMLGGSLILGVYNTFFNGK
jgi:hypothetical protein